MRNGTNSRGEAMLMTINNAPPLPAPMVVFRGINRKRLPSVGKLEGIVFTSTNNELTNSPVENSPDTVLLKITLFKGMRVLFWNETCEQEAIIGPCNAISVQEADPMLLKKFKKEFPCYAVELN